MSKQIYYGAIVLFYKKVNNELYFLIQKSKTGKYGFISGARENEDNHSPEKNAWREVEEEIGLKPDQYKLIATNIKHEFMFGEHKKNRAGAKGEYSVFLSDINNIQNIEATDEIESIEWVTYNQVLEKISFDDLREVFIQATKNI